LRHSIERDLYRPLATPKIKPLSVTYEKGRLTGGGVDRGRFIQGLLTGVAKNRGHLTGVAINRGRAI